MIKAMKKDDEAIAPTKLDLEINPAHPIIVRLEAARQKDAAFAADIAETILDQARVAAGVMEDPRSMLKRMNSLLERVLA
jgi:TNF receptor-associated protein 1